MGLSPLKSLCPAELCRYNPSPPVLQFPTSASPQHQRGDFGLDFGLNFGLWVETSAQATKPCCYFGARSGKMEEIPGGEAGKSCREGSLVLGWAMLSCETSRPFRV